MTFRGQSLLATAMASVVILGAANSLRAEPLAMAPSGGGASSIFAPVLRDAEPYAALPSEPGYEMPARLRKQVVAFGGSHAPGTIVIDTAHTYLYFVLGSGRALRYGIGVGREGFTWSGVQTISRMAEWPDWSPPAEMIRRQPYLPRFVAGGPGNPLGARALYLGASQYRIHGTNDPSTIGRQVSSGCIRMTNEDVSDLYARVRLGATVVVLPGSPAREAAVPREHVSVSTIAGSTPARQGGLPGLY